MGLYRISESIRAYMYLILSLQASVRSRIIGNTASALTAQKPLLNGFENIVNHRVDVQEDINHHQDTLSYALGKVNYSMEESVFMLPSDMNLSIGSATAGYNNEILIFDGMFSLGRNDMVNTSVPVKTNHRTPIILKHTPMPKAAHKEAIPSPKYTRASKAELMHEEEKVALVLTRSD